MTVASAAADVDDESAEGGKSEDGAVEATGTADDSDEDEDKAPVAGESQLFASCMMASVSSWLEPTARDPAFAVDAVL